MTAISAKEQIIKGWYLKRTPVPGYSPVFISLCKWEVVVGRFTCCSPFISREHVLFQRTESNDVFIKDLKTMNGTFLNGKKIKAECLYPIHQGDRIALGKEVIKDNLDFEFELCFTKHPLKLTVVKTLPARKGVSREKRRRNESQQSKEEEANLENAPFSKSRIENYEPNGASGKLLSTLDQPSGSGVTRISPPHRFSKRSGSQLGESSQPAKKRLHSSEENYPNRSFTFRKFSPLEIDLTDDYPQKEDYHFAKDVVQENPIENRIDLQTTESESVRAKCSTLKIDTLDNRPVYFGNEVIQKEPIENYIGHQTTENETVTTKCSALETDKTLDKLQIDCHFGKKVIQEKPIENHTVHQATENESVSTRKYFPLQTDITLDNRFGKEVIQEKPAESLTDHQTTENETLTTRKYCPLENGISLDNLQKVGKEATQENLIENQTKLVKSNKQKDSHWKKVKDLKQTVLLLSSSESGEEGTCTSSSERKAENVNYVLCSDYDKDVSPLKRKDSQDYVPHSRSESDKEHTTSADHKAKNVTVMCHSKDVSCSDYEDVSLKPRHSQDSVQNHNVCVESELCEEDEPASRGAKRQCSAVIGSDEQTDVKRPNSSLLGIEKSSGKQDDGDATSVPLQNISSHSETPKEFQSSFSCHEAKLPGSCSNSLTKGGEEECSICEVADHLKKVAIEDTDKFQNPQESDDDDDGFTYSQVDEVVIISSDEDDDLGVVFSSKTDSGVRIKLEPNVSDTELKPSDPNTSSDFFKNNERLETTVPEYDLSKFQWTEDPDEDDCSDFWPELSQSFDDEDDVNKPQDETSLPGPSKSKLSFEETKHQNVMEVTTTSHTEELPSDDDDDLSVVFTSKSNSGVPFKLEPKDLDNELTLNDPESTPDSLDNTERMVSAVRECEGTKFQMTEGIDDNDYSDWWPQLSQSFNNIEEDEMNEQHRDETSRPGPSNAKLEELIHRQRMKTVSTTSFTEALPNTERRQRRNGRMEDAAQVEVKGVSGKKSDNWISKRGRVPNEIRSKHKPPKKGHDIRKIVQEEYRHRIPMPGGGSAIRSAPTSDGSTRISKTTNPQINHARSTPKSKVNKPIPPPRVPKKAPKLTTEQRFPSRQEALTETVKLKTVSPSKICGVNKLANFKIPLKPKPVQKVKTPQNRNESCEMKNDESACKKMSSVGSDNKHLDDTSQLLHNAITSKRKSDACKHADKTEILEIPNILAEKAALNSLSDRDPRMLKASSSTKSKNTTSLAPKVTPSNSFCNLKAIHKILNWRTVWLKEQHRAKSTVPPPVVDKKLLREVALSYTSFDEYCDTYYPLLMLEIWASVFKDWNVKNKPCVKMCINHYCVKDNLWELHCQAVIPNATTYNAKIQMEGHLVIIALRSIDENNAYPVFGYVTEYKSESLENVVPPLIRNFVERSRNGRLATYVIKVATRNLKLDLSQLVMVEPMSNIKPKLRQMDAIFALHSSVLVRDILCARRDVFVVDHKPDVRLLSMGNYNHLQEEAILGAADAISQPYPIPQIRLFQGPPGTGKTSVIIGLIQQILHPSSGGNQKLLVVTSSNGAIDEIASRLIKVRERLKKQDPSRKFRLVRVGLPTEIRTDVKSIFIDELASKNLMNKSDTDSSITQKIKSEEKEMYDLQQQLENTSPSDFVKRSRLESELLKLFKQINFYRNQLGKEKQLPHYRSTAFKKQVNDILKNADVILSTINSSRQSILEKMFGNKNSPVKFTCCIVDEATQCTEPELLTPLQYGISKLILVGDPKQLPATVLCQRAMKYRFNMSLFERVFNFFERNCDDSPVLMLTEQYRMHSEIVRFPSQHFYAKKLSTPQMLDRRYSSFPLKPYVCIDMPEGKENSNNVKNIRNPYEAILVTKLCEILLTVIPPESSVGIITFYRGQKEELSTLLNLQEGTSKLSSRVEVESVDGFQGREKDVIILSCVRTEINIGFLSNIQRMNVAITRARKCFIVCGNLKLLRQRRHWKELIDDACRRNVVIKMTAADSIGSVVNQLKKNNSV